MAVMARRCASLLASIMLLTWGVAHGYGERLLAQDGKEIDVLANLNTPELVAEWFPEAPKFEFVLQAVTDIRLLGAQYVPWTVESQQEVLQSLQDAFFPDIGPVELVAYREAYPDPSTLEFVRGHTAPSVDLRISIFYILNPNNSYAPGSSADIKLAPMLGAYKSWAEAQAQLSGPANAPQMLFGGLNKAPFPKTFILRPLVVLAVNLTATLIPGSNGTLTAERASVVAEPFDAAVAQPPIGTLVEVVGRYSGPSQGTATVALEATLYLCRDNATLPSPECEQQILAAILDQVIRTQEAQAQWQAAGIEEVEVGSIIPRQPPHPSNTTTGSEQQQQEGGWVPWHLDRLDQRSLPLDGAFTANATGKGVSVFVVSSGVRGDHAEFLTADGSGSRVQPSFGYEGVDPLTDCKDYNIGYGWGTLAASLCCGRTVGVAKDASILSVRFRESCISRSFQWGEGALPAALDLVLSAGKSPAVVLIDIRWNPGRLISADIDSTANAITARLDQLAAANLTVIAAAGGGDACINLIANHPAVISVGAVDNRDQAVALGSRNSTCIEIWAPSGGLGVGMIGAYPDGPHNFTQALPRSYGAAALLAGVAAQYLELHPAATPAEVREFLHRAATPHAVYSTGLSPASLAYTNLTQSWGACGERLLVPADSSGGQGPNPWELVGILLGLLGAAGILLAGLVPFARRRRRASNNLSGLDWHINGSTIKVQQRPDGSEWVLSEGKHGQVLKALKNELQVVAVVKLEHLSTQAMTDFEKEMREMQLSSRDANIVQFYGACFKAKDLLLVVEYMEGGDLRRALSAQAVSRAEGQMELQCQWLQHGKSLFLDALKGAHFLHTNGIVHGDICSQNVLLNRGALVAKLAEVGLAALAGRRGAARGGADTNDTAWTAPEVLLGEAPTTQSDIWSLGVVLWEFVTLEVPQPASAGSLREPRVPSECPQEVADAIKACLQSDPARRPSAKDLHAALLACEPLGNVSLTQAGGPRGSHNAGGTEHSDNTRAFSRDSSAHSAKPSMEEIVQIEPDKLTFCTRPDGSRVELGKGAFSVVYKVLLDGIQQLAAKVVDLDDSPGSKASFMREASMLWRLRHKSIIPLSGMCFVGSQAILLMELAEGGSLDSNLHAVSKTTGRRAFGYYDRGKSVAYSVAAGLQYLHSLGVTHFDLKTKNILLTAKLEAKLADVGLARVLQHTHHSFGVVGAPAGALAYMAPELLAGERCGHSVDIYSYGVCLWEVCTGERPVQGKLRALQVPAECPQAVADLCARCMAADPAQRPSAREVMEELREATAAKQGSAFNSAVAGATTKLATAPSEVDDNAGSDSRQEQRQEQQGQREQQALVPLASVRVASWGDPVPHSPFVALQRP